LYVYRETEPDREKERERERERRRVNQRKRWRRNLMNTVVSNSIIIHTHSPLVHSTKNAVDVNSINGLHVSSYSSERGKDDILHLLK